MTGLLRYRDLVDDWQAFEHCIGRPLPTVISVNGTRIDVDTLRHLIASDGIDTQPLSWSTDALKLSDVSTPGRNWWHHCGLCHLHEEASLLPVTLLDPQPGERILDLCAAPGGKTARIAMAVGHTGTVVANDVTIDRLRALQANLERLALGNVSVTRYNGANYPGAAGRFDRVLLDAPCTGEGTLRKNDPNKVLRGPEAARRNAGLQKALLERALGLCRPGGRVVYSTCSFAPEENEAVVDSVLRSRGGSVSIVPIEVPGLRTSSGIDHWEGETFDASLRGAIRLWPHQNDTGGFFAVALQKAMDARCSAGPVAEIDEIDAPELRDALSLRFGVPDSVIEQWVACRRSGRGYSAVNRAHRPPPEPAPEFCGLSLFHRSARFQKVTTAGAALFGPAATRHVIDITPDQTRRYVNGENIMLSDAHADAGPGHVIVRCTGAGIGIARRAPSAMTLESLFPRSRI